MSQTLAAVGAVLMAVLQSTIVPFLVVDLVVSNVLLALGLTQLSPTSVALPFKLLLFVLVDGWNLVTGRNSEDAKNFGRESHYTYADRYDRAEEFIDVVNGLWDSYDDDASLKDLPRAIEAFLSVVNKMGAA